MSSVSLKARARNLQKALQELLNQPVKLSQAYEVIAREEGFVNWDAASPSLKKRELAASPMTNIVPWTLVSHQRHPDGFSLDRIIEEKPSVGVVLDLISKNISLTVVTGLTGSGKSSFASAMICREIKACTRPLDLSKIRSDDFEKVMRAALRSDPEVVFVGELRTIAHVEQAVSAVRSGHRVIATMHGAKGRTLYESLCSAIPGIWASEVAEGFRSHAGWNHHHIHIEFKPRAVAAQKAPLEVSIQGALR